MKDCICFVGEAAEKMSTFFNINRFPYCKNFGEPIKYDYYSLLNVLNWINRDCRAMTVNKMRNKAKQWGQKLNKCHRSGDSKIPFFWGNETVPKTII